LASECAPRALSVRDGREFARREETAMSRVALSLMCAGTHLPSADAPKPTPVPARPVVVPLPPTDFSLAPQPVYGQEREILPAHRLAWLEFRVGLPESDPR